MGLVVANSYDQHQLHSRYLELMEASTPDVVDFITEHFHEPLKKDMQLIERRLRQLKGEKGDGLLPVSLRRKLSEFIAGQNMHLFKEESFLFPMMASVGSVNDVKVKSIASQGIQVLRAEHGDDLHRMHSILKSLKVSPETDIRVCRLLEQISEMYDKLHDHICRRTNTIC